MIGRFHDMDVVSLRYIWQRASGCLGESWSLSTGIHHCPSLRRGSYHHLRQYTIFSLRHRCVPWFPTNSRPLATGQRGCCLPLTTYTAGSAFMKKTLHLIGGIDTSFCEVCGCIRGCISVITGMLLVYSLQKFN